MSINPGHSKAGAKPFTDPAEPTPHAPGTTGKIAVLAERARRGLPLWHPLDSTGGAAPAGETHNGGGEEDATESAAEANFPPLQQARVSAEPLALFCCQSEHCPDYGKRGAGNLTVVMRYGKHRRRLLCCKTCKSRFSERKGTPLFHSRLPDEKARCLLAHLTEGCGVRETARLVGVTDHTVERYSLQAGRLPEH